MKKLSKLKEALSRPSDADTAYCSFRNDRERRNALVSRDIRLAFCHLLTVAAVIVLAFL